MPQYSSNTMMMQPNTYVQQPQQSSHSQMYTQGQMSTGPYMNNQIMGNPAK